MKSINDQFPEHPLPTRNMGDGIKVIIGCVIACTLISIATCLLVIYGGLDATLR